MLLAEDLLLLLTDDATGKPTADSQRLGLATAGALLLELVLAGRVAAAEPGRWGGGPRVDVVDATPLGDPILDEALARTIAKGRPTSAQSLLGTLGKGTPDALRTRLAERGILRREEGRILGLFPTDAWPAVDARHETEVRRALGDVLLRGRQATAREACLVSLLHAIDQIPRQFADAGVGKRELRDRAKAISAGNVGGEAVKRAIDAANAAVMAGITAATVVSTTST